MKNASIFDFMSAPEKKEMKEEQKAKKQSRRADFFAKWNLTQECLTDNLGKPLSNTIVTKAMKFIELDAVKKCTNQPSKENGSGVELWNVEPIPEYNKTTYTIYVHHDEMSVEGGCNCQYSLTANKTCSHLLAVLIMKSIADLKRTVRGGVRFDLPKKKVAVS